MSFEIETYKMFVAFKKPTKTTSNLGFLNLCKDNKKIRKNIKQKVHIAQHNTKLTIKCTNEKHACKMLT
jgi:hypothetical protein